MTSTKESDDEEEEEVPKLKARSNSEPRNYRCPLADMVDDIENAGINGVWKAPTKRSEKRNGFVEKDLWWWWSQEAVKGFKIIFEGAWFALDQQTKRIDYQPGKDWKNIRID